MITKSYVARNIKYIILTTVTETAVIN